MIDKTSCDRDDRYLSRNECMESRLNRPYRLTKNSVTETITQKQSLRPILRIVEAKPGPSSQDNNNNNNNSNGNNSNSNTIIITMTTIITKITLFELLAE